MGRRTRMGSDWRVALVLVGALAVVLPRAWADRSGTTPLGRREVATVPRLALRSSDLAPGNLISLSQVYDGSGCHGGNTSPALSWSHPPEGTLSFVVLMLDTDAPGGDFWHWAVFDIPARARSVRAGAGDPAKGLLPAGAIQVRNDWGLLGYGGPCPPPGPPHHYHLILYALRRAKLGLYPSVNAAQVAARARADALAEAEIVGVYGR